MNNKKRIKREHVLKLYAESNKERGVLVEIGLKTGLQRQRVWQIVRGYDTNALFKKLSTSLSKKHLQ